MVVERLGETPRLSKNIGLVVDDDKAGWFRRAVRPPDTHDQVDRAGEMSGELDPKQPCSQALGPRPEGIVPGKVAADELA